MNGERSCLEYIHNVRQKYCNLALRLNFLPLKRVSGDFARWYLCCRQHPGPQLASLHAAPHSARYFWFFTGRKIQPLNSTAVTPCSDRMGHVSLRWNSVGKLCHALLHVHARIDTAMPGLFPSTGARQPRIPSHLRIEIPLNVPPSEGHHRHAEESNVGPEALTHLHVSGRSPLESQHREWRTGET